jgi:hypothetical protein
VWVKTRVTGEPERVRDDLFGAVPATVDRHPILGIDPVNCTPQLGVAGRWSDRLPHFRMGFTPSAGDELQSEYHWSRVTTRWPPWSPCGPWPASSGPCSRCRSCGPWPPTGCG